MRRILYHTGQWLSALALMLLVTMTVADIVLRWAFNSPIYGSSEIANFLLSISVGAGLMVTTSNRGHIRVDMLEGVLLRRFGSGYQRLIDWFEVLGTLVFAGLIGFFAYESWQFGEVSVVLEWPTAPVFLVAAICAALSSLYIFKPFTFGRPANKSIESEGLS